MIKRLRLSQWKAYESLDLELGRGTTFLVADNGIGKTSIIQALYFALFGGDTLVGLSHSPLRNAIRVGAETATVECELELVERQVVVVRTMSRASKSFGTAVTVDGEARSESDLRALLREETVIDPAQLALLSIVSEGAVLQTLDAGLDITSALSSVFGVDSLRTTANEFLRKAKQLEKRTDDLRKSLRDAPSRDDRRRREELEKSTERLDATLRELLAKAGALEADDRLRTAWKQFRDAQSDIAARVRSREERLQALVTEASPLLPDAMLTSAGVDVQLHTVRDLLGAQRDALVSRRAVAESRLLEIGHSLEELAAGGGMCPVCRRPLSNEDAELARHQHQDDLRQQDSDRREAADSLAVVESLLVTLADIERQTAFTPASSPPDPEPDASNPDPQVLVLLKTEIEQVSAERLGNATELRVLGELDDARRQNDELSRQLRAGYSQAERATIASQTMHGLADAICAERITPIAIEAEKRWLEIWPGDTLSMASDGGLALQYQSGKLPFSEFSGGQRTLAHVLLRLLALQMATRCPFLVLDEPLEHLDPRNRRLLAALLVRASSGSPLRQVVVTTYEESVTRRLDADPSGETGSASVGSRVVHVNAQPAN